MIVQLRNNKRLLMVIAGVGLFVLSGAATIFALNLAEQSKEQNQIASTEPKQQSNETLLAKASAKEQEAQKAHEAGELDTAKKHYKDAQKLYIQAGDEFSANAIDVKLSFIDHQLSTQSKEEETDTIIEHQSSSGVNQQTPEVAPPPVSPTPR